MKKYLFFTILLFLVNDVFSQLYVSSNSFVFAKNNVVYVRQNVNLQNNSNIYLRNEAQLVQGTTGLSTNVGLGKLSVYQEGTSDNFDYNYWCSPIGNASATVGNENFGITMLNNPTTNVSSTPVSILASSYNGIASPLSISSYWIWKFLSSSTYSQWFQSAANPDIAAGQGFTMKGTSGTDNTNVGEVDVNNPGGAQRYDFRGKPNDGTITVNVATNNFTLTGNPYPSALHVNAFLLDPTNTDCTGIAYYWEHDKTVNSHNLIAYRGGYGTYSPVGTLPTDYGVYVPATFNSYDINGNLNTTGASSGLSIERKYAPIGQGFMVRGKASGAPVSITLKNAHRTFYKESNTYSQFEKNGNNENVPTSSGDDTSVSYIRLNTIMNNEFTRQMALVLVPQATDGVDRGIDAKSPTEETLPNDVYFFLDNDRYVIEGVSFDIDKRIPVGIKATNATFKFSLLEIVNFDVNQDVFIYDALDGSYHNLKIEAYQVNLETGIYNSRFEITFKDSALNTATNTIESLVVVQNNTNQLLSISNPNLKEIKTVQLYDISGKLILNKETLETKTNYEFATNALSEAVYIVKIATKNNEIYNQKIIVERTK